MRKLFGGLVAFVLLSMPTGVFADSYDVTASVPAPLPATLPIISLPPIPEQEVSGIYITGTCDVVVPTLVVVLLRNNEIIGSGNCLPNGTFRVFVGLVLGTNVIYAKYVTITGETGQLGVPITFTYAPKQSYNQATTATEEPIASTTEGLELLFDYDFVTYDDTAKTAVSYTIRGGVAPYTVSVSWGDGTQTTQKKQSAGTFSVAHQYKTILEPSQISIQVEDANGQKRIASRALVSFRRGVYVPAAQPQIKKSKNWWYIWVLGVFTFSVIALMATKRHDYHQWFAKHKVTVKTAKKQIKKRKRT